MNQERRPSNWTIIYSIATVIIAGCALVSLCYSISTSKKITDSLATLTEPLVKFKKVELMAEGELSCENLPHTLIIVAQNTSSVPVQIRKSELKLFHGNIQLSEVVSEDNEEDSLGPILSPGEIISYSRTRPSEFKKYFSVKRPIHSPEPSLTVSLKIEFNRLNDTQHIAYFSKQNLYWDCSNPATIARKTVTEQWEKL